jgi:hypothetical protein
MMSNIREEVVQLGEVVVDNLLLLGNRDSDRRGDDDDTVDVDIDFLSHYWHYHQQRFVVFRCQ